jgi:hypothetical protein
MDLTKLSDADLEALQAGDLTKLSDEGLMQLQSTTAEPAEAPAGAVAPTLGEKAVGALQTGAHFAGQALSNPFVQHGLEIGGGGLALNKVLKNAINQYAQSINPSGAGMANQVAQNVGNQVAQTVANQASSVGTGTGPNLQLQQGGLSTGAIAPEAETVAQASKVVAPAAEAGGGMLSRVAPYLQTAGKIAAPVARVAGPAGMAMAAYDAAKYAQQSGLGQRLAQGEGARGMQAFHNLSNQNVSGYILTPQEAKNVLASGDERTINMYGGRTRLQGIISAPNAVNSGFTNQLNNLSR